MKYCYLLIAFVTTAINIHAQSYPNSLTWHFSDTLQHWAIVDSPYGSSYIKDGEYFIHSTDQGMYSAFPDIDLKKHTNFKLSYLATWHEGVENYSYGIRWGEKTGPHACVFQVNHGKWVDVWDAGDTEQKHVLNTFFCSSMRVDMFNRYTIECRHHQVRIWINDDLVYSGKLKQYEGYICFQVYNQQTVSYDEVKLEYKP